MSVFSTQGLTLTKKLGTRLKLHLQLQFIGVYRIWYLQLQKCLWEKSPKVMWLHREWMFSKWQFPTWRLAPPIWFILPEWGFSGRPWMLAEGWLHSQLWDSHSSFHAAILEVGFVPPKVGVHRMLHRCGAKWLFRKGSSSLLMHRAIYIKTQNLFFRQLITDFLRILRA